MSEYVLSPLPGLRVVELEETTSTNDYARRHAPELRDVLTLVIAEFQSKGRGATGGWESKPGENLLFSLLTHPTQLPPTRMFRLSVAACLAICRALRRFAPGCRIKWPNDIYHGDGKMVGILIENELRGKQISDNIIGIGINVNQQQFESDAPNPTSLALVLGHKVERSFILDAVVREFHILHVMVQGDAWPEVFAEYKSLLYRKEGIHPFRDSDGIFQASIVDVEQDGNLVLRTTLGETRRYGFKEVQFVI